MPFPRNCHLTASEAAKTANQCAQIERVAHAHLSISLEFLHAASAFVVVDAAAAAAQST